MTLSGGTLALASNTGTNISALNAGNIVNLLSGAQLSATGIRERQLNLAAGTNLSNVTTVTLPSSSPAALPRPAGAASGAIVLDNRTVSGGTGTNPLTLGSGDNFAAPPVTQSTTNFATLDLNNNDLVLYYNTPAEGANLLKNLDHYVKNAFDQINNSVNTGTAKITSSLWAVDPQSYGLAVANNADLNLNAYDLNYPGTGPHDYNQIVVKFTFAGDMNLDGLVDAGDYGIVDGGILAGLTSGATYADGDSNYDGAVNEGDYAAIDGSILAGFDSGVPLAGTSGPTTIASLAAPASSSIAPLSLSAAVSTSTTTADPALASGICQTTTVAAMSSFSTKQSAPRAASTLQPTLRRAHEQLFAVDTNWQQVDRVNLTAELLSVTSFKHASKTVKFRNELSTNLHQLSFSQLAEE